MNNLKIAFDILKFILFLVENKPLMVSNLENFFTALN